MDYTNIFSTDPNNLSMGAPTVNTAASVASAGTTPGATAGIQTPTAPVAGAPVVPGAVTPGATPGAGGPGFFGEGGIASMALGAVQTLGSLWNSFQQNKMAKESFEFQKEAYATNLENQEKSYNTALEDRITARYRTEGKSRQQANNYIDRNSL